MKYIATTKYCFPVTNLLRNELVRLTGMKLFISTDLTKLNPRKDIVVLRYGNSQDYYGLDYKINPKEFIRMCSHKLRTANFCYGNNINSVQFYNRSEIPEEFPIILRDTLTGSGGVGIHICEDMNEFNNSNSPFWTLFLKISSEYRVVVVGGKIVSIKKKVREDGLEKETFPIRSHLNGYRFSLRSDISKFPRISKFISDLESKLPEHYFYGADVGILNGNPILFELNSAFGMDTNSLAMINSINCILDKWIEKGLVDKNVCRAEKITEGTELPS